MTDFEAVFHEQGVKINRCVGTLAALPDPAELGEEPALVPVVLLEGGRSDPRGLDKFVEEWRIRQKAEEKKEKE